MEDSSGWKLFQKRIYDILSHRHGTIIIICGCILVLVSAFQFGETFLEWSEEKYATVFNSFSDNLAGRSYRKRLCLPVPIDVVYTWVNGTDPKLIYELRKHKDLMEQRLNQSHKHAVSTNGECPFPNCVPTNMLVIDPPLPSGLTRETLGIVYPWLKPSLSIYPIKNPENENLTVTVVEFDTTEHLKAALNETILVNGKNTSIKRAYYTSDWTIPNAVLQSTIILLSGFPSKFTEADLTNHLPKQYIPSVHKVEIHNDKGIAVITMTTKEECDKFLEEGNVTIEGKEQQVNGANMLWDLRDYSLTDDVAANRFEDNEELRYSLRSIEQYAPWVRQVFLVTNGQIPYWLNLDSPRLTLVTHEELFENKSHLPSFSSPAIESHIHKIPGLSDRFIYMNDDVMFGREVWPDDFYTHSKGQKIYLTWPVPNCQDGCPSTWIKDGYCDKACNNSECDWDGGDCKGGAGANQGVGWGGAAAGWGQDNNNEALYCNSGCANNWLADKYCDQACNVPQCGYDAGDCGTSNYEKLHEVKINTKQNYYQIPPGENILYLNISVLFGVNTIISDGRYDDKPVLRSVAIAQKFKVVTIVLHSGHNATKLNFTLIGKQDKDATDTREGNKIKGRFFLWHNFDGDQNIECYRPDKFNFTLSVDTKISIMKEKLANKTKASNETKAVEKQLSDFIDKFQFQPLPVDLRGPRAKRVISQTGTLQQVNMTLYMLPEDIEEMWVRLQKDYKEGLLTEKGFRIRQSSLWEVFSDRLKSEGKSPIKRDFTKESKKPAVKPVPAEENRKDIIGEDHVEQGNQLGVNNAMINQMNAAFNQGVNHMQQVEKIDYANEQAKNPPQMQDVQQPQAINQNLVQNAEFNQNFGQNNHGLNQEIDRNAQMLNKFAQNVDAQKPAWNGQPLVDAQQFGQNVQGQNFGQNMPEQQPGHAINQDFGQNVEQPQAIRQDLGQFAQQQQGLQQQQVPFQQQQQILQQQQVPFQQQEEAVNQNFQRPQQGINPNLGQNFEQPNVINQGLGQNLDQAQNLGLVNNGQHQAQELLLKDDHQQGFKQDLGLNPEMVQNQRAAADQDVGEKLEQEESFKSRKLNGFDNGEGLLPWEKDGTFAKIQKRLDQTDVEAEYETSFKHRQLLDKFSDSLRFVNKLYNTEYGFSSRKVPAHMPHMIDRNIVNELQAKFPKEWDATSSHQVRHSKDMQYAFSYFYYIMSEPNRFEGADVFDAMDTDNSGILSDREIRTLATRLYDLPLDLPTLTGLEQMLINCSKHLPTDPILENLQQEQYYDTSMPQVTKHLFVHCPAMSTVVKQKFKAGTKYRYEVISDDSEVVFKMIRTNVSSVVGQLDDVRKNPKKFICLNDNIDHNTEQSKTVKAVLQDFYESIFPIPSSFELPREYRNRFLHIQELREWRKFRDWLKTWTQIALCLLIVFTLGSFFSDKLEALQRRVFGRRQNTSPRQQKMDV